MRRSKSVVFSDFSGGMNADDSPTTLALNQALELDNLVLLPKSGFKKRNGNSEFNATAMDSGAAVHGLGYYRQPDSDEWMLSICGNKLYKSDSLDGTMDDISGSLTITSGQNYIWNYAQMNSIAIFVGGNRTSDVPIKWTGTGNGAVLGGTPPVGNVVIQASNRLFIANTETYPSRINWSVLGDPEDWSGAGSGEQDVSANDGDEITALAHTGTDHLIIFKQGSIHELPLGAGSPFPCYPLYRNVGAISGRGVVDVNGILYFITPEPRMKAFDGTKIIDFPGTFDAIWDGINKDRLSYLEGRYDRTRQLILWFVSDGSSTTNNLCIVWDLERKCWLRFTTGHNMNCVALMQDRKLYAGSYDGKIYELDSPTTVNDASESVIAINAYWRSGWLDLEDMINSKHIPYIDIGFKSQTSGTFDFAYGYDFLQDSKTVPISQSTSGFRLDSDQLDIGRLGGQNDKSKMEFMKGNGKFFQFLLKNNGESQSWQINKLSFPVKVEAPYALR